MRLPRTNKPARAGFTLIELLVVIAIIGVLAALTLGAVMQFFNKPAEMEDRSTLDQLGPAINTFYAKYNFYPPSRLYLSNNRAHYNDATRPAGVPKDVADASLFYLSKMFPNLQWSGIDWTGGNPASIPNGAILEGDQCLVFFLGGIPGGGAVLGFSADNSRNPTALGGGRIKFFDFKTERLKARSGVFPSYYNTYDKQQPYAYFCSYSGSGGRENWYHRFIDANSPTKTSDCNSLGVWPYCETATPTVRYVHGKTFQIISAGPDGTFGTGTNFSASPVTGFWTANTAGTATTAAGRDDLSNFHGQRLGAE